MFVGEHVGKFASFFSSPPGFSDQSEGESPLAWFDGVDQKKMGTTVATLPGSVNRKELLAMAANPNVGTLELCISIFAWGEMRTSNRNYLFRGPVAPWITIADQVRSNKLSRSAAYDCFARLRVESNKNPIAGMGPAYFTKLLYFLPSGASATPKGYIMDQWLGCSVNLLTGRQVVKLDHYVLWNEYRGLASQAVNSVVSNSNSGQDYEEFCLTVEALSAKMGHPWTPERTERALMSSGGREKHAWRNYVREKRLEQFSCARPF
jgi:hypothetical protein